MINQLHHLDILHYFVAGARQTARASAEGAKKTVENNAAVSGITLDVRLLSCNITIVNVANHFLIILFRLFRRINCRI